MSAQSKLVVLHGGGSREAEKVRRSDEGTAMIAYMIGVYDKELRVQKVPATLRHKLCVAFQAQLLSE